MSDVEATATSKSATQPIVEEPNPFDKMENTPKEKESNAEQDADEGEHAAQIDAATEDTKAESKESVDEENSELGKTESLAVVDKEDAKESETATDTKDALESSSKKTTLEEQLEDVSLDDDQLPAATKKEESSTEDTNDEPAPVLPPRRATTSSSSNEDQSTLSAENKNDSQKGNTPANTKHPLLAQLEEAFPQFEEKYIVAVAIASQGNVEAAYNALLYLADPSATEVDIPVNTAKVPPAQPAGSLSPSELAYQEQLKADELLARQLSERYNAPRKSNSRTSKGFSADAARKPRRVSRPTDPQGPPRPRRSLKEYNVSSNDDVDDDQYADRYFNHESDEEDGLTTFIEKDLPMLKDNVNKSLRETSSRVGNWIKSFSGGEQQQQQQQSGNDPRNSGYSSMNANDLDESYYNDDTDDRLFLQDSRYSNQANVYSDEYVRSSRGNNNFNDSKTRPGMNMRGEKKRFNSFGNSDQNLNHYDTDSGRNVFNRNDRNKNNTGRINIEYGDKKHFKNDEKHHDDMNEDYMPPPTLPPRRSTTSTSTSNATATAEGTTPIKSNEATIDTPFNDNKKFKTPAKMEQEKRAGVVQLNEFDAADDDDGETDLKNTPLSDSNSTRQKPSLSSLRVVDPEGASTIPWNNANRLGGSFSGGRDDKYSDLMNVNTPTKGKETPSVAKVSKNAQDEDDLDFSD